MVVVGEDVRVRSTLVEWQKALLDGDMLTINNAVNTIFLNAAYAILNI